VSESQGLVLVVDDDSDVRESLELLLARHGYSVVTAADGLEALDRLRALPRQPSLIMLDLMMPHMNGMELQRVLQGDPRLMTIPVVVITGAGARVTDQLSSLTLEMLPKPFDVATLLRTVRRMCGSPATGA
jgi:CheY-like chemotaxis protein